MTASTTADLKTWLREQIDADQQLCRMRMTAQWMVLDRYFAAEQLATTIAHRKLLDDLLREDECPCDARGHHFHEQDVLPLLGLAYQLRPGYREEWLPEAVKNDPESLSRLAHAWLSASLKP